MKPFKNISNSLTLATLLSVALAVAGCGDGSGGDGTTPDQTTTSAETTAPSGEGGQTEVVMRDISFQPDELTVPVGTTVTWTNEDSVAHTTTSEDDLWDSGSLSEGDTFSFTFEEPGTYEYVCSIHPDQMQGTITVEG